MNDFNEKDIPPVTPAEQNPLSASAESTSVPGGNAQYWSSQDARRAQQPGYQPPPSSQPGPGQNHGYGGYYGGQSRFGQQPYQRPYDSFGQNRGAPYQYNANTGWQQPRDRYEWNFEDYDKFSGGKRRKKSKGLVVFAVSVLGVLFVALVAMSAYNIYSSMGEPAAGPVIESSVPGEIVPGADGGNEAARSGGADGGAQLELASKPQVAEPVQSGGRLTIPQVAKKLLPSVVSVETYQNNNLFEAAALGSGIIMSEDGYIITNHHVVAGASAVKVTLDDGEAYEATVVGSDERTDLAVLKVSAPNLVPAEFGDSTQLDVGETVIAIGNPASLELKGSVTQGIVSAVNRTVRTGTYSMTFIQTDAAINPGNSGGALVNEFGQVVGINSSKIVQEGFEGIGFAIPVSDAKPIIDDLIAHGRVTGRVMLGITAQAVDEITARNYNVPMGLMIREIDPSSDLMRKGVQARDIITHIDGERVYTLDDLRLQLDKYQVGSTIRLTLFRQSSVTQGTTFDVSITLIEDRG